MPINNITQTISTIPEAGRRGIDVQTVFVNKQEDFQDHLQGTTVTELNALKTQMNTMAGEMNTTASQVNTNANTASTKASEASASATSASASASTASTKANQASASASTATTQAGIATTKANEASASASTATTKANEASVSASTATTQAGIATQKALEASQSATSASQSLDSIDGILATLPDGSVNDTLIGLDKAFSNQSLVGAFGSLSSPLLDLPLKNSLSMKAGVGSTTFTRASTATYIDRYGVLKTANIDEPRFEKDGILNEESSTNLLTYSDNMLNGYLTARAALTLSTTELSPDGITYATEFRETTDIGLRYLFKPLTFTAGTTYTYSIFAKSINGQNLRLSPFRIDTGFDKSYTADFNLTDGTISGSDASNAKMVPLSNGWYRCSITATCTTTTTFNTILVNFTKEYNSPDYGLYIFGVQLEEKPFASSYIPTTDSTVTRVVTNNSITAYGNAPSKDEGTIYCRFKLLSNYDNFNYIWALYNNTNNNIRCYVSSGGYLYVRSNSARGLISGHTSFIINTNQQYSVCATWKDKLMKVYINGVLAYQQSWSGDLFDTKLLSLANFSIGKYTPNGTVLIGNGNYKSFKTYDKALTPTEIALLG